MRLTLPDRARNPLSLAGVAIATATAAVFLVLFVIHLAGLFTSPYIGLLVFFVVPALFLLGLALIPLGAWRSMRRGDAPTEWPVADFGNPRHRTTALAIFALTAVNVVIVSLAAYGGVHYMDFDISDRTRDRVSLMLQVTPWNAVGLHATGAVGLEHRPDAAFGLQDNDMRSIAFGIDLVPSDAVGAGLSYGFENHSTVQRSRQANPGPQFDDPTRDWETDMDEDVHTWSATLDVRPSAGRLSLATAYDYVRSTARYLYVLPSNSSLPPPQQLPEVFKAYHRATVDVRYALTRRVAIGLGYELDKYDVQDFARSPDVLSTPLLPAFVNLLYQWRPYDVHAGSLRLIYGW